MSPNEHKNFDKAIQKKLESFQPEVHSGLWEKIQSGLDNHQATGISKKPRKINVANWSIAAAVVILAGAVLLYSNRAQETIYLKPVAPVIMADRTDLLMHTESIAQNKSDMEDAGESLRELNQFLTRLITPKEKKGEQLESTLVATVELKPYLQPINFNEVRIDEGPGTSLLALDAKVLASTTIATGHPNRQANINETPIETIPNPVKNEGFGVSRILNLVVAQVDKRPEKFISFSDDEEGSIKVDFNLAHYKNNNRINNR